MTILMVISPLINERLHTVCPTDNYSCTFNVTSNEFEENFEKEHMFRNCSCIVS